MFELKNKTILILSPQAWGKMFLSKHHYALELAKQGNNVYFLNPPEQTKAKTISGIEIEPSGLYSGLHLINHRLAFPYRLKFHANRVFHWLMRFHVKKLLAKIGHPVDIVWSFDLGHLYPLHFFDKQSFKIYHPVDEPLHIESIKAAAGAQLIFSVTREILEKYRDYNVPKHFINHGVSDEFILEELRPYKKNNPVRIGLSGNLLRQDIDRDVLLQIIRENQNCIFEFWGSTTTKETNIGGKEDSDTVEFISTLKKSKNVILHGAVTNHDLAESIQEMDAFLICYDVQRDQSRGTNYHKVMEYLGTGKAIVSNNVTTYKDNPELVLMIDERDCNKSLPALFKSVVSNLDSHNSIDRMKKRILFARENTYSRQIERIEKILLMEREI